WLIGDHAAEIFGLVLEDGAAAHVQVRGVVATFNATGAEDQISDGAGDDLLAGDSTLEIGGLLMLGGAGKAGVDADIRGVADDIALTGAQDQLTASDSSDVVIGDHVIILAGLMGSVSSVPAPAPGSLKLTVGNLGDTIDACGADDQLKGGAGDDTLLGDHFTALAATIGPILAGSTDIEMSTLVNRATLSAGRDTESGEAGNDYLAGDSDTRVARYFGTPSMVKLKNDTLLGTLEV